MKTFYSDPAKQKAAMILASMSADMVRSIVLLCATEGFSVITKVNTEDGPPRPLAMFSNAYVSDEDFPEVFVGALTVMLANFRTLKHDAEFYKNVLMGAFSIPDNMAETMSKNIETRDIIGGSPEAIKAMSWWDRFTARAAEDIRRIANIPSMLGIPWYNDQDQQYDIDFLYELKRLGSAVNELQSRFRLVTGQANAAASLGLFKGAGGTSIYKGLGGGDPFDHLDHDTRAELALLRAAEPLMGDTLPGEAYGGLEKFVGQVKQFASRNLKSLLGKDGDEGADPAVAQAYDRLKEGPEGSSRAAQLVQSGIPVGDLITFITKYMQAVPQTGDVADHYYARVEADYGPEIAEKFAAGDLPGAFSEAIRLTSGPVESTGDTALDDEIVGDVYGEEDSVDTLPEVGGLFKKLRAKIKLKKAARIQRKKRRVLTRQHKRNAAQQEFDYADQQLAAARNWAPDFQAENDRANAEFYDQLSQASAPNAAPSFDGYSSPDQSGMVTAVPATEGLDYFAGINLGGPPQYPNGQGVADGTFNFSNLQ